MAFTIHNSIDISDLAKHEDAAALDVEQLGNSCGSLQESAKASIATLT